MLIHKDALAVSDVASDCDGRYFLNGALFDKKGRAVATNGHVLVRFTSAEMSAENFPEMPGLDLEAADDVIVGQDDLKAARATMARRSNIPALDYLAIVPNGDTVTLATNDLDHDVRIKARKVAGTFPAYEKVLTVAAPQVAEIVLSPENLEIIARIALKVGCKSLKFRLHGDPKKGILMDQVLFEGRCASGTLDGAVMPMRW